MKITDEMVERAYNAYYAQPTSGGAMRRALEAAMNPPPVVCKNCGRGESRHIFVSVLGEEYRACYGYVWEPAS